MLVTIFVLAYLPISEGVDSYALTRNRYCPNVDTGTEGCELVDPDSASCDSAKSIFSSKYKINPHCSWYGNREEHCTEQNPCICVAKGCKDCSYSISGFALATDGSRPSREWRDGKWVSTSCVCGRFLCGQNVNKDNLYCSLTSASDDTGWCTSQPVCQHKNGQIANTAACICVSSMYAYGKLSESQRKIEGAACSVEYPFCNVKTTSTTYTTVSKYRYCLDSEGSTDGTKKIETTCTVVGDRNIQAGVHTFYDCEPGDYYILQSSSNANDAKCLKDSPPCSGTDGSVVSTVPQCQCGSILLQCPQNTKCDTTAKTCIAAPCASTDGSVKNPHTCQCGDTTCHTDFLYCDISGIERKCIIRPLCPMDTKFIGLGTDLMIDGYNYGDECFCGDTKSNQGCAKNSYCLTVGDKKICKPYPLCKNNEGKFQNSETCLCQDPASDIIFDASKDASDPANSKISNADIADVCSTTEFPERPKSGCYVKNALGKTIRWKCKDANGGYCTTTNPNPNTVELCTTAKTYYPICERVDGVFRNSVACACGDNHYANICPSGSYCTSWYSGIEGYSGCHANLICPSTDGSTEVIEKCQCNTNMCEQGQFCYFDGTTRRYLSKDNGLIYSMIGLIVPDIEEYNDSAGYCDEGCSGGFDNHGTTAEQKQIGGTASGCGSLTKSITDGEEAKQCVRIINLGIWTLQVCFGVELSFENMFAELKFELISALKGFIIDGDIFGLSLTTRLEMTQGITALAEDSSLCEFPQIKGAATLQVSALPPLGYSWEGEKAGRLKLDLLVFVAGGKGGAALAQALEKIGLGCNIKFELDKLWDGGFQASLVISLSVGDDYSMGDKNPLGMSLDLVDLFGAGVDCESEDLKGKQCIVVGTKDSKTCAATNTGANNASNGQQLQSGMFTMAVVNLIYLIYNQ